MQSAKMLNRAIRPQTLVRSVRAMSDSGASSSSSSKNDTDLRAKYYPNTQFGIKERSIKPDGEPAKPILTPFPPFPEGKNPKTGEVGGPAGPEPTVYGDWQRKGRVTDF